MTDALIVCFERAGAADEGRLNRLARRINVPAVTREDDAIGRGIQAGRP